MNNIRVHFYDDCINVEDGMTDVLDHSLNGDTVNCVLCIQEMYAAGLVVEPRSHGVNESAEYGEPVEVTPATWWVLAGFACVASIAVAFVIGFGPDPDRMEYPTPSPSPGFTVDEGMRP